MVTKAANALFFKRCLMIEGDNGLEPTTRTQGSENGAFA